ncbi:MAG TPA: DNA-processing protein DprA [Candidatus Paceibacterota bacterium]
MPDSISAARELLPPDYPAGLNEIPEPPEKLWLRGAMPAPGHKLLAVVGSRALTRYGRDACEMLIAGLAGYPVSIVSGLALGADACAHRAALASGLHTIAIPGSGLNDNVIGPKANGGLAREILLAGGALLSEHEPDYLAHPHDFPSRNRIMVGLSHAVLVIEAGDRSGTLITARLAGEYSRDLLCVPHRINDPHGYASAVFIRLGAALVTEPKHILEALGIPVQDAQSAGEARAAALAGSERAIYELLADPVPRDELIRRSGIPIGEALTILVSLELKGLIREEFGAWRRL